jgi:hypothetical protein
VTWVRLQGAVAGARSAAVGTSPAALIASAQGARVLWAEDGPGPVWAVVHLPAAIPATVIVVTLSGVAVEDAVHCVGGVWRRLTADDDQPGLAGVVVATGDDDLVHIQCDGPRWAPGTPGMWYYAASGGGAPTALAPAAPQWRRRIEVQIDTATRLVQPDATPTRVLAVDDCEEPPQRHYLSEEP